jgi:hypothetical protein
VFAEPGPESKLDPAKKRPPVNVTGFAQSLGDCSQREQSFTEVTEEIRILNLFAPLFIPFQFISMGIFLFPF